MLNYLLTSIVSSLIGAMVGFVLATAAGRLRQQKPAVPQQSAPFTGDTPPATNPAVDQCVTSIYELTSQVDHQVGQHSSRVNEITNFLNSPNDAGSAMIAVAGKMLVSANQQLQQDLIEAKEEIQRQRELMTSCLHDSRTDPLTNIANRRGLDHELTRIFSQRRRSGATFSILIIDIDYFKRVNDRYGHLVGDQLLKNFARCLANTFRESDFVARFGGEEFVAILPMTSLEEACRCAERIRSIISACQYKVGDLEIRMTTSIGVKEVQDNETDAELLQKADKALYAAKNGGRNCSYFHDGTMCHRYIPAADVKSPESNESSDEPAEHALEAVGAMANFGPDDAIQKDQNA